jgi:aspartyl/asparaginyl-tRNA synthetase
LYGELSSWPTFPSSDREWTEFKQLQEELAGKEVLVRGRLSNSRVKGNLAFLVLRDNYLSVQCVGAKNEYISKQMINFIKSIQNESIVEITATVVTPQVPIESCT